MKAGGSAGSAARAIYRALGAEDISATAVWRPRGADAPPALARLRDRARGPAVASDGEPEKVAAFEALGIERELLPSRLYRGAAGETRRYFPVKMPVALDSTRAVFVYAEPGHETATALHSWGATHRGLWHALTRLGRSVEAVAVGRTDSRRDGARAKRPPRLGRGRRSPVNPTPPSGTKSPGSSGRSFRARSRSSRSSAVEQAGLKRSVALEDEVPPAAERGAIRSTASRAWRTTRLAGALLTDESPPPHGRTSAQTTSGSPMRDFAPRRCAPPDRRNVCCARTFAPSAPRAASADRAIEAVAGSDPAVRHACCGHRRQVWLCAPLSSSPSGRSQPAIPPGRDVLR